MSAKGSSLPSRPRLLRGIFSFFYCFDPLPFGPSPATNSLQPVSSRQLHNERNGRSRRNYPFGEPQLYQSAVECLPSVRDVR